MSQLVRSRKATAGAGRVICRVIGALVVGSLPLLFVVEPASAGSSGGAGGFFAHRTLDFISDGGMSTENLWARSVAPALGRALGATVQVQADAAAAPLGEQGLLAAAPDSGLTLGTIDPSYDIGLEASGLASLAFKLDSFEVLAVAGGSSAPLVWCVAPSSKYQSFTTLLKSRSVDEGAVTEASIEDVAARSVDKIFGIDAKLVGGYPSDRWVAYGFEEGVTSFAVGSLSAFLPLIEAGKAKPVLLSNPIARGVYPGTAGKLLAETPTIAAVATSEHLSGKPMKAADELTLLTGQLSGFAVAVPAGVAAARAGALATAFGQAARTGEPRIPLTTGPAAAQLFDRAVQGEAALSTYGRS